MLVRSESPLDACEELPWVPSWSQYTTLRRRAWQVHQGPVFPLLPSPALTRLDQGSQGSALLLWRPPHTSFSDSSSEVAWQHSETGKVLFPWHSRANVQSAIRQQSFLCALFSGESLALHQEILGCGFLKREWEI